MCDACARESKAISRRGLVRLLGLGASGAAVSAAALRFGGAASADDSTPGANPPVVHWTYEGEEGPEHWGELDPSFATCSGGTEQSPIDVTGATGADLVDIEFNYGTVSPLHIVNNGHTIQVNVPEGNSIVLDDTTYGLLQFHFHTPSEHAVDGQTEAMELHLVHKAADGTLAVVGVLLHEGAENAGLKPVFEAMPVMAGPEQEVTGTVDLASLLPETRTTFRYLGSLTTPPCTEGVHWNLFTTPAEVSPAQVAAFRTVFENDARPLQPLNERTTEEDTTG